MKITRIFADDNGVTHFDDAELPLIDKGDIGKLSELEDATGIIFRETPGDYDFDWHPAPRRQYVLMLEGGVDIEVSDGEKRRLGTGDVLLLEDTPDKSERGHKSTAVDGQARMSVFVTLD